jgi:putative transposase
MEQRVRKAYKYKLMPTPEQALALERVLWRCRTLYNTAVDQRKTAWERCHVSITYYQQKAELPDLKRACPEFAEVHAHVLQDVILRMERTY